jgi:hypothetical protein
MAVFWVSAARNVALFRSFEGTYLSFHPNWFNQKMDAAGSSETSKQTNAPRCKSPNNDYHLNNIHLENLRTNIHFLFLPQRKRPVSSLQRLASSRSSRKQSLLITRLTYTLCPEKIQSFQMLRHVVLSEYWRRMFAFTNLSASMEVPFPYSLDHPPSALTSPAGLRTVTESALKG